MGFPCSHSCSLYLSLSNSLAVSLSVVWRASAVDRKILISPRFGACTFPSPPPLPTPLLLQHWRKPNQLPGNLQHLYGRFYVLHFSPWHWQFDCGVSRNDHVHKPQVAEAQGMRHENHQASTTATCLNVSHIESAIKHTKWLRESARVCVSRGGRGVRASIIHHKHFYGRSHLLPGPLCPPSSPASWGALLCCCAVKFVKCLTNCLL